MMDLMQAANLLSFSTEYVIILYFFSPLERQGGSGRWLGLLCLAFFAVLYFPLLPRTFYSGLADHAVSTLMMHGCRLLCYWAAVFGYLWFSKAVKPSVCLYLAGYYCCFSTVCRNLSAIAAYICGTLPSLAKHAELYHVAMTAAVLAIEFFCVYLTHCFVPMENIRSVGRVRVGLILMANFLLLYFKYSVFTLQSVTGYSARLSDILFYPLCAMGSVLAFLILFESFQAGQERQKKLELEQMAQRFELRYVKRSTQAQADIRRIHHDMKNHLLAIRGMERHSQVSGYVDSLLHELADYDACVSTGLPTLDPFLSEKLYQARLEQVQFNVCLDLQRLDFIAYTDLISIFGNAMDNALEAVRALPAGAERVILLKSRWIAGEVILYFGNPYAGEVRREGTRFLTVKADQTKHGIGLNSITKAVERYGGSVNVKVDEEEKWFGLTILIPLP